MEKKTGVIIVICLIALVITVWFLLLALNPEPHFRIIKKGVEVKYIEYGSEKIEKAELNQEWLDNNCQCYYNTCNRYVCGEYLVEIWSQIK